MDNQGVPIEQLRHQTEELADKLGLAKQYHESVPVELENGTSVTPLISIDGNAIACQLGEDPHTGILSTAYTVDDALDKFKEEANERLDTDGNIRPYETK